MLSDIFADWSELVGEIMSHLFLSHCEWCLVDVPRAFTGTGPPAWGMWRAEPLYCETDLQLYQKVCLI